MALNDMMSAVPNEPPTWFIVLETAVACCTSSLSSELTPQVLMGVVSICRPMLTAT